MKRATARRLKVERALWKYEQLEKVRRTRCRFVRAALEWKHSGRPWVVPKGWKPVVGLYGLRGIECVRWSVKTHERCGHRLRMNSVAYRIRHESKHRLEVVA